MRPYTELFPDWRKRPFTRRRDGHPVTIERCGAGCMCYGYRLTVRERNEFGTPLGHEDESTVLESFRPGDPDWIDELLIEVSNMKLGGYRHPLTTEQRARLRAGIEENT